MELVGKTIKHVTFGKGVIASKNDNILTVDFSGKHKKFLFPDAFSRFISISDEEGQAYIGKILDDIYKRKNAELLEQERLQRIRFLKITPNSQAAFGLIENNRNNILNSWSIFTGNYLSGYSKGTPRVPTRLRLNSACLLTECPDGSPEEERRIIGAFMVADEFEGKYCKDGVIQSHDTHRLLLDETDGELLYWNYFSSATKSKRWGKMEMKYFSTSEMERILDDMQKVVTDPLRQKTATDLYQYFCEVNRLNLVEEETETETETKSE